ncbi:hypothetical protein D0Z62_06390 [Providencia rettgeri]|uniref:hypothetical protein n=1 Tax=Providencia rettgeri TaxID=587 RepID=UPI0010132EB3|nr:hypothetical protein [Providencia rettgeri]RXN73440.1 hypothetical protein D0Z62_06390 [Providencia rettgeri]
MTTQTSDLVNILTACTKVLNLRVAQVRDGLSNEFPNKNALRTDISHQLAIAIMAEQAEKLLSLQPESTLFGLVYHEYDYYALIKLFLNDLVQFTTLNDIDLGINLMSFGQTRIAENSFYHLAASPLLLTTYKTIDQHAGQVFDTYSIPFKLRLALELKLRTITGFEKYEVIKGKKTIQISHELPFSRLLKELQVIDCLKLPCSLANIKNIYQWACNFCHTGEKEYLWFTMKALELVSPLFIYQEQKKFEVNICEHWSIEGINEEEKIQRHISFGVPVRPLYYLSNGWTVQRLQDALNDAEETKRIAALAKGHIRQTYKYSLSETNLTEIAPYYCSRTKQYF